MPNDLIAMIKAKQAEIAKLQAELDEAKALLAGGLQPKPINRRDTGKPEIVARGRDGRLVAVQIKGSEALPENSAAYWAAAAIRAAGRPLHAREIVQLIETKGEKVKPLTLVGSLSRWVKRRVFYRAGPNVFGLTEMRDAK